MSVTIRRAGTGDAAVLASMERICFGDPWSERTFSALAENPSTLFLIAETADTKTPVGYIGASVVMDECDIINLAVMPDHRRSGIGRLLANEMLEICKRSGVQTVYLEHRKSNTAAAFLYASLGFENDGIRRKYYTNPTEDAILMSCKL